MARFLPLDQPLTIRLSAGTPHARSYPARPSRFTSARGWAYSLGIALGLMIGGSAEPIPGVCSAAENVTQDSLKGIDLDGQLRRFAETPDCQAVAVVFLATQCPISNGKLPTLSRLAAKYRHRGIEFYGVVSSPHVSRADAARHRDEFKISFPVLFDASAALRRTLKPTHTPQALVLSPTGELLYSGRIDNEFPSLGRKRIAATEHEFEDALDAVVSGRNVPTPATEPVGCLMEDLQPAAAGNVTFNRDIAPIIFASCSECHRPGEAAPFALLTYADVQAHARQIAAVTASRLMPPWHPAEGFGNFQHERRLDREEIALIEQWVAAGAPEGDAKDSPHPPRFVTGWQLGKPDLVLRMSEAFPVSAAGTDIHQHFVLPTKLRKGRMVSAIEFRPGNPRVVHHASFYVDVSGAARRLDDIDPAVGYGSFSGAGFDNYGALRSWLPGMMPQRLPEGMGSELPANSDVVLEIHYKPIGKLETDQSSIGIFFADSSARQHVVELQVMNKGLEIPAGVARHHHAASFKLPVDVTLLDAAPHMHMLGKEMKAVAKLPDGSEVPLIWVKEWDFNWQGQYLYIDPVRLPQGTVIHVDAWYDNSEGNPYNPHSPPQTVRWGEETDQEMAICHFRYTCDTYREVVQMNVAFRAYVIDQQSRYKGLQEQLKAAK